MARRAQGFTIIETSLVLAITGLIVFGILFGIGNALNSQRYTDAVNQMVDFFRGQYTQITSTVNDRAPNTTTCTPSGDGIRGASDCLLTGRIVRGGSDGVLRVYRLIAKTDPSRNPSITIANNDNEILAAATLSQDPTIIDSYSPEWGAKLTPAGSSATAEFTLMVVRTPISGTVHTFTSGSSTTPLTDLIDSAVVPQNDRSFCMDPGGSYLVGAGRVGIRIQKDAANTTGVQTIASGSCA